VQAVVEDVVVGHVHDETEPLVVVGQPPIVVLHPTYVSVTYEYTVAVSLPTLTLVCFGVTNPPVRI
jgi:hypothetical protein